MMTGIVFSLFVLGGLCHWYITHLVNQNIRSELAYWQKFQGSIELERVEMGRQWAAEDLHMVARGLPARGCPRGTPGLTLNTYLDVMDAAPIPVEIPEWTTQKIHS